MTGPPDAPHRTVLQALALPEPGLSTERDLFVRLDGAAGLSMADGAIIFGPGGEADFGTYGNLFNLGKWVRHCGLRTLALELHGEGTFELTIFHARPERSWDRLVNEVITLGPGAPVLWPITHAEVFEHRGTVFFELHALGESGRLAQAAWVTEDTARRQPDLTVAITTFRREAAVAQTAARFEAFVAQSPIAAHLHLVVVDNGRSADIAPGPHVTCVTNENLGGAGGFARGLIVAQQRGASHCLFMDDDASASMAALERVWTFLAYAEDPATAVAGAVANAQHRWQLWESGALFDRLCRPLHMGTDLRDPHEVMEMEFASTPRAPHNFYGGWWFFAFPLAAVRHLPFPFFVRGDDVSFSLVHDFNIVTLPGVISYQDEDFSTKESPLTVYLDLRSHLVHHLALPRMEIGRLGLLRIVARFWLRSFVACHYETLEAVALAQEDVLKGPDFFAENADMATRRAEIGALTDAERWRPVDETPGHSERHLLPTGNWLGRTLMKLAWNGHLLPGFAAIGNRITLPATRRGQIRPLWGAAEITYVSPDGKRSYTVRHSKRAGLRLSWRILRGALRLWRGHDRLSADWRAGYDRLTGSDFWKTRLGLTPD